MISLVLSVRNNAQQASNCLSSITRAFVQLKLPAPHVTEANLPTADAIVNQRRAIAESGAQLLTKLPRGSHRISLPIGRLSRCNKLRRARIR